MRDAFSGRGKVSYDDLDDAQRAALRKSAERFLRGEADVDSVPADSLKMVREAFMAMRGVFQELDNSTKEALEAAASAAAAGHAQAAAGGGADQQAEAEVPGEATGASAALVGERIVDRSTHAPEHRDHRDAEHNGDIATPVGEKSAKTPEKRHALAPERN